MPCNADHMNPNEHEAESKRIAEHLVYLQSHATHLTFPQWVFDAAEDYYGNCDKVHELTALLCKTLSDMIDSEIEYYIYEGRSKQSRALADWWEDHQEVDRQREEREAQLKERDKLKMKALSKLSDEEKEVLGLDD